jgi:hypothetical protein
MSATLLFRGHTKIEPTVYDLARRGMIINLLVAIWTSLRGLASTLSKVVYMRIQDNPFKNNCIL